MRIGLWGVAFILATASFGFGQPVPKLSESDIQAAIELGRSGKASTYPLGGNSMRALNDADAIRMAKEAGIDLDTPTEAEGGIFTPFVRVALAAQAAREIFKPFSAADVTPDMTESVFYVMVPPKKMAGARIISLKHIVMMPADAPQGDISKAIQPLWTKTDLRTFQNLLGTKIQATGMVAAFPMSALAPRNSFVLIWDGSFSDSFDTGREMRVRIVAETFNRWR